MSERKNIDRLFQEKFRDFEVSPPELSWNNIEAKLDEKKKRRIFPLWWKLSGVAALLLIGLLIYKSSNTVEIKADKPIVIESNLNKSETKYPKEINKNKQEIKTRSAVVNEDNSNKIKITNTENINKNIIKNNRFNSGSNSIANTNDEKKNRIASEEKNRKSKIVFSTKTTIVERKILNPRSLKNKLNTEKNKNPETVSGFETSQYRVDHNQEESKQLTIEKEIIKTEVIAKTEIKSDKTLLNFDDLKGNIISKNSTKEIEIKVNDTAKKNSVANNVLEELLNEKESKLKKESKVNRWQLSSNVAPIFLGSVSSGSPIDSTLAKNSKSYDINVGYGIGVSYAVNKKFSVRTGLNKVSMSYNTSDILFFTGIQSKVLQNVSPAASSAMIHVRSSINTFSSTSESGLLPFENTFVHENKGSLNQRIGYLEMPVEMTYNLLDKKFGLKIIGGFSTLLLQDNKIIIVSEGRDTVLGEANNLNNIHFSTNLGLGIKYGFMKSFEFNVEPTVKYQINTFSSNAGSFKPYLFGIYSGISYKF